MNYLENKKMYVSPNVEELQIQLEYGIASASVESSAKQSWEDESSSHSVEW